MHISLQKSHPASEVTSSSTLFQRRGLSTGGSIGLTIGLSCIVLIVVAMAYYSYQQRPPSPQRHSNHRHRSRKSQGHNHSHNRNHHHHHPQSQENRQSHVQEHVQSVNVYPPPQMPVQPPHPGYGWYPHQPLSREMRESSQGGGYSPMLWNGPNVNFNVGNRSSARDQKRSDDREDGRGRSLRSWLDGVRSESGWSSKARSGGSRSEAGSNSRSGFGPWHPSDKSSSSRQHGSYGYREKMPGMYPPSPYFGPRGPPPVYHFPGMSGHGELEGGYGSQGYHSGGGPKYHPGGYPRW